MNAREPIEPSGNQLSEHLLAFDSALAAGHPPDGTLAGDLPPEWRDGFSCLQMLERLRLDLPANVPAASGGDPQPPSSSGTPAKPSDGGTSDEASAPVRLGKFEILKILGQGGCGVVFLARDPVLNRVIALKIPRPEILLTPEMRQRFLREGRAAGCLDHPNLLPVFEAGEIGAVRYLASPYCPGITLREWLRQQTNPVPPTVAARFITTLAGAMHHAHQKGICHRDLKPSNILLSVVSGPLSVADNSDLCPLTCGGYALATDNGQRTTDKRTTDNEQRTIPKIIDFGLAKIFHEGSGETITGSGAVMGTPQYMAPEQAQGSIHAIGPAADVHALGAILYELLTRKAPYQGGTDMEVLKRVITIEPSRPSRLCPRVSRDLDTICLKYLEKEPGHRYASMQELAAELERFLDGHPIQARPIGWAARATKWVRRRPGKATATALLLFVLTAVAVVVDIRGSTHSADMERALQESAAQKARAEERDWQVLNFRYASQIRAAGLLRKDGQVAALNDALLSEKPAPGQKDVRGFEWHYLWRSAHGSLPARRPGVTAIAYSQNGAVCAVGNVDGTIHLFDRHTGTPRAKLQGHSFRIETLDFIKEDTQMLSTAFEETADRLGFRGEFILWSLGAEPRILRRGSYAHHLRIGFTMFAFAPAARRLFIIDRDNSFHRLLQLDLNTGKEKELLKRERLDFVSASPQADRIAIIYNGADTVEIVDPATGKRLVSERTASSIFQAVFSPDGMTLAVGLNPLRTPHFVQIWEVPTLRLRHTWDLALLPVDRFRFDAHGKRLAVLTEENQFPIFDVQTGGSLRSLKQPGERRLAFSPDGEQIALGGDAGLVRAGKTVFDPLDDSLPGPPPQSEAWCAAFAPPGNTLAVGYDHNTGAEQQTLLLWDLTTKKARTLPGHDATVMALALSSDGKTLASASYDRSVRLWDLATGQCRLTLKGHTGPVRAVAFSPDGLHIASAGSDLSIKVWNIQDGSLQKGWQAHIDLIRALAFSPDGNSLISAANDQTIKVWSTENWTLTREIATEAKVQCVACSPDGTRLASGDENNRVEIWDISTGELIKKLPGHTGRVRSVAFSPDGKTLASGGEVKTVRLWNVLTGEELLVFPTEHFVNGLAFDGRGKVLAAALHDGTVKVWAAE